MKLTQEQIDNWSDARIVRPEMVQAAANIMEMIFKIARRHDKHTNVPSWRSYAFREIGFEQRTLGRTSARKMFKERPKKQTIDKILNKGGKVITKMIEYEQVKKDYKWVMERLTLEAAEWVFGYRNLDAMYHRRPGYIKRMRPMRLEKLKVKTEFVKMFLSSRQMFNKEQLQARMGGKKAQNKKARFKSPLKIK